MYRKRIFFMLLSIIIFAAGSVGLSVYLNRSSDIQNINSEIVNQSENTVISRALAAKMIALMFGVTITSSIAVIAMYASVAVGIVVKRKILDAIGRR